MYHASFATAAFLMNFRALLCLYCTKSDNVLLRQETDSTEVSKFQHLLHSQLADFDLHFELLTNGVEHLADFLVDLLDFAVDVVELKFRISFSEQICSMTFQCVAWDTIHLLLLCILMGRPGLLCFHFTRAPILSRISAPDISVACARAT